jgi:hypothetical protein
LEAQWVSSSALRVTQSAFWCKLLQIIALSVDKSIISPNLRSFSPRNILLLALSATRLVPRVSHSLRFSRFYARLI